MGMAIITTGAAGDSGVYATFWLKPPSAVCRACGCLGYHAINCPETRTEPIPEGEQSNDNK